MLLCSHTIRERQGVLSTVYDEKPNAAKIPDTKERTFW